MLILRARRAGWLWPALTALVLLPACRGPASSRLLVTTPAPPIRPAAAPTAPAPAVGALAPTAAPQRAVAPTSPADAPLAAGAAGGVTAAAGTGGAGAGAGGVNTTLPPVGAAFLVGPNSQLTAIVPGPAIPVPAGLVGQVSVFAPGFVPSTVDLPAGSFTLHPAVAGAPALPTGLATVSGTVAGAGAGLTVQYLSAGRRVFAGGSTDSAGAFAFDVPVGASEQGLVVARTPQLIPQIALARVTIAAGATIRPALPAPVAPASAGGYRTLGFGSPGPGSLPALPAGMAYGAASLQIAEGSGTSAWRAPLVTLDSPLPPTYSLAGFTQVHTLLARAPDGSAASETSGPPGAIADCLAPPDLSAVPTSLAPGSRLTWPSVRGATLYTVRLVPANQATLAVWEGASTNNALTLPVALAPSSTDLIVQVDAWDAPEVGLYGVVSLGTRARSLRVPAAPTGPTGRHAWSLRRVTFQPPA